MSIWIRTAQLNNYRNYSAPSRATIIYIQNISWRAFLPENLTAEACVLPGQNGFVQYLYILNFIR